MAKKKKQAASKKKVVKRAADKSSTKKKVTKKVAKKASKKGAEKAANEELVGQSTQKGKQFQKGMAGKSAKKKAVKKPSIEKVTNEDQAATQSEVTQPEEVGPALPQATRPKAVKPMEQKKIEVETPVEVKTEEGVQKKDEIILTDADGRRYCSVADCDQVVKVESFCRYHYLLFWKQIQVRKKILSGGKLEKYIRELTSRFSDKFIETLMKDLCTEKDFAAAIQELEIDEHKDDDSDEDEAQGLMDEVRGVLD